jgi:hypothetical protein
MEILVGLLAALIFLAIPFIMPIVAWLSARNARHRIDALETEVADQRRTIDVLSQKLRELSQAGAAAPREQPAAAAPAAEPVPIAPPPQSVPPRPERATRVEAPEQAPRVERPERAARVEEPGPEPAPRVEGRERAPRVEKPIVEPAPVRVPAPAASTPAEPPGSPPVMPEEPEEPPSPPFDWESLVGVKLFSAFGGIALVFGAVFFLKYSIDQGWLQPPVRVAIGVVAAIGLLVACELKAARRYPATANALDAAAIAILFATFFAAHALWDLIPALVTFALLAVVTALAVLLSIRRESLFIAVLGLLGGFATPALLSTGENRPIPLFAYLLMLNVGLAWIAYQKGWTILTWLTLILTTVYQWGWVMKFLDSASIPLAMAVFIVFPLASVVPLILGKPALRSAKREGGFEAPAMLSAAVPVLFAIYLAAVPEYGARPGLLFGFVLLIDLGLLAIAIARQQEIMHAAGALGTMLTIAVWLATSYSSASRLTLLAFTAVFSLVYLFAPAIAGRFGRRFGGAGESTTLVASVLLFVFPVLAGIDAAFAAPWLLFGLLAALVVVIAARAVLTGQGTLYFVAAFFAVAAQAVWSASHLTLDRLSTAVAIYTLFGLVSLGVPIAARRMDRPLEPKWGGGVVLLVSLALLMFIAAGDVAPAALWALALLLAILNAALFIESGAGGLPLVSQAGSVLSWLVLLMWWGRAAASVGVIPSLTVLTGLTLMTLAGHAWTVKAARRHGPEPVDGTETAPRAAEFANGLYLALAGHLFLTLLASNPDWSQPPWPVFGALLVMTLGVSAASLVTRVPMLHAAGAVATAIVVASWSTAPTAPPHGTVALIAAALASAYALAWIRIVPPESERIAATAVGLALFIGEASALAAVEAGGAPPFPFVVAAHVANVAGILWLTWRYRWRFIAVAAVLPAWLAVAQSQVNQAEAAGWQQTLVLVAALYAVFVAYPLLLGRRASAERDPYLAAVFASVMFFFGARAAFLTGNLEWMIGVVPVAAGAVLALLLRQLLAIQQPGERDTGRLALVAGAALACVTVAIPLQLEEQWITIGWALEGAALAWLYRRMPHRGLLYSAVGLLAVVFVRLALNPEILVYEPRGALRILNWYLYTYVLAAAAMFLAGWWLSTTDDALAGPLPRPSAVLPAAGVILLFLLLNIEIADFYATGPTITFRFGVSVSQDLTYTIGWLVFGMGLLAAGIYLVNRAARVTAVFLIAITTFKCFLYDLSSLEGLYRVGSFVGLGLSLALVSLALQKYVLAKPRGTA